MPVSPYPLRSRHPQPSAFASTTPRPALPPIDSHRPPPRLTPAAFSLLLLLLCSLFSFYISLLSTPSSSTSAPASQNHSSPVLTPPFLPSGPHPKTLHSPLLEFKSRPPIPQPVSSVVGSGWSGVERGPQRGEEREAKTGGVQRDRQSAAQSARESAAQSARAAIDGAIARAIAAPILASRLAACSTRTFGPPAWSSRPAAATRASRSTCSRASSRLTRSPR